MKNNGDSKAIVELWGQDFNIVSKGLNEGQMVTFVSRLIGERDVLAQRVEHLSALTRLAEKTVVESERLAEEIKKEAVDQANAEANAIIASAKEQAEQLMAEKRAEIINIATKEAEAIKAEASQQAKSIIERQVSKIQPELRDTTQRVYDQLQSQLENLKQQVVVLNAEFEQKLSQPVEEAGMLALGQESRAEHEPNIEQQENGSVPVIDLEANIESVDVSAESQQPTQPVDKRDTSELETVTAAPTDIQDVATSNEQAELEILSPITPINLMKIMKILEHLDSLPETESTELAPLYDRPLIIVSLREPLPLSDTIKTLPEIEEVREDVNEEIAAVTDTGHDEKKLRKIQIRLSEEKVALHETNERLNNNSGITERYNP